MLASPLRAQEPNSAKHDSALRRALRDVEPQTVIRVRTTGFPKDGRFQGVERDTLLLGGDSELQKIPTASVNEVYTRYRQVGRGAAIGAATGGILFGAFGIFVVGALCDSPGGCKSDYPNAIAFFGVLGAGGGAIIGSALGALAFGWRRVFP